MVTEEADRTGEICYDILAKIPNGSSSRQSIIIKSDLYLLADQVASRCPSFSAAGFFTLNYTIITSILSSVTTYITLLLQLKH